MDVPRGKFISAAISYDMASQAVRCILQEHSVESSEADAGIIPNLTRAAKAAEKESHPQYEDKGVQAHAETCENGSHPQHKDQGVQVNAEVGESGTKRKRMLVVVSVDMGMEGSPPRKLRKHCAFDNY